MRLVLTVALVSLSTVAVAHPRPPDPEPDTVYVRPPPPPPAEPGFALTASPLHLLLPMLEVTGEYRVGPELGVAGILGAGRVSATDGAGTDLSFTAAELGASVRYYAVGSFHRGVQIGAEVMYLYVKLDEANQGVQATGDGLSVSPFGGYKWTGASGFTAEAQLGLSITVARAHASDGTTSATNEQSRVFPLINANLGWSF